VVACEGIIISDNFCRTRPDFAALVNQAAGAITWNISPTLRSELPKLVPNPNACTLHGCGKRCNYNGCINSVVKLLRHQDVEKTIIYSPFVPATNPGQRCPGHLLLWQGVSIWQKTCSTFCSECHQLNTMFG